MRFLQNKERRHGFRRNDRDFHGSRYSIVPDMTRCASKNDCLCLYFTISRLSESDVSILSHKIFRSIGSFNGGSRSFNSFFSFFTKSDLLYIAKVTFFLIHFITNSLKNQRKYQIYKKIVNLIIEFNYSKC